MAHSVNYDKDTGFVYLGRLIPPILVALATILVFIYGLGMNAKIALMAGLAFGTAEFFIFTSLMSRLEKLRNK